MSIMKLLATMSDDQWQILSQIQQFQALVALVDTPERVAIILALISVSLWSWL